MDESKASITLQNKVLLWLFGGGVNAHDQVINPFSWYVLGISKRSPHLVHTMTLGVGQNPIEV
jgi:hypothetical protein